MSRNPDRSLVLRTFFLFLSCWLLPAGSRAQAPATKDILVVDSIKISGNRKTRRATILRELDLEQGDTIHRAALPDRLDKNRLRVLNLGLFTDAEVFVFSWKPDGRLDIGINVKEGWYTYPVPVFELADRNFNVWWHEFDRSLRRVNYGVNWFQLNLTGRRDILRLNANFGYTNLYELSYTSPAVNKQQTLGFQFTVRYSRGHELAYKTDDNKPVFLADPNVWQMQRWHGNIGFTYRPEFYTSHRFVLEYHRNEVSDNINGELNPDFFLDGAGKQRHFSFVYGFLSDHRDVRPYPLNGWLSLIEFRWNGLLPSDDLHLGRIRAEWRQYFQLAPKWSTETIFAGRTSFPRTKPPYFNNQGLGYGSKYVRGYEYFVADGLDYGLLRTALHLEIVNFRINLGKLVPLQNYREIPFRAYLSLNNDLGYANDPYFGNGNPMSNRLLYGYGLGLDLVVYYDKLFKLEYSRNDLGMHGFYLNLEAGF